MFVCSVQIISRLDSQSKFQMFTLFSAAILVHHRGAPTWRFHTGLCKFLRNISTNICILGKHLKLKLEEVSFLSISYKITISWLYPPNGFRFIIFFLSRDRENDLFSLFTSHVIKTKNRNHSIYINSRIWDMIDDCYINNLVRNQVSAVFHSPVIRRSVSPKFIGLCMETPCLCPSEKKEELCRAKTCQTSCSYRVFHLMKLIAQNKRKFLILEYDYVTWKPRIGCFSFCVFFTHKYNGTHRDSTVSTAKK